MDSYCDHASVCFCLLLWHTCGRMAPGSLWECVHSVIALAAGVRSWATFQVRGRRGGPVSVSVLVAGAGVHAHLRLHESQSAPTSVPSPTASLVRFTHAHTLPSLQFPCSHPQRDYPRTRHLAFPDFYALLCDTDHSARRNHTSSLPPTVPSFFLIHPLPDPLPHSWTHECCCPRPHHATVSAGSGPHRSMLASYVCRDLCWPRCTRILLACSQFHHPVPPITHPILPPPTIARSVIRGVAPFPPLDPLARTHGVAGWVTLPYTSGRHPPHGTDHAVRAPVSHRKTILDNLKARALASLRDVPRSPHRAH